MHQPRLLLHVQNQREHHEGYHRAAAARTASRSHAGAGERTADARALRLSLSHPPLTPTAAETSGFSVPAFRPFNDLFLASPVCKEQCMHRVHDFAC